MQPTLLTNEDFGKLSGVTARGVTSTSGGRQEYGDSAGNTYYRNEQNVGTPQYSTSYEKIGAAPSSPVTIVTSGQSRTNYANNVNTLQTAQNNLRTVQAGQTASGIAASLGLTPEEFLKLNPEFAGKGGARDYKGLSGDIKPGQTYKISADGTPAEVKTDEGKPNADGSTTNPDGTTNPPGTSSVTTPDGKTYAGIDPGLKKMYEDSIGDLDKNIASAKDALDQAKATLANDPAAIAAVEAIKAKYDVLIQQMKDKNNMLLGSYKRNSARSGSLQFANDMNSDFMSDAMGRANQRVSDLVAQETSLILKTQEAYKNGDVKALDSATKAYQQANKDKLDAINDLLKATNDAVKIQQADAKLAAATAKQQISDDIRVSTGLAQGIVDAISDSGVTDEEQIDQYIEAMAEKSGIANVDILKSAIGKARQTTAKFKLGQENTASIIQKRKTTGSGTKAKGGGKDGGYTYTGDDVTTYNSLLNEGGESPDGVAYNSRGKDGYVDPGAYIAAYEDWVNKKNGTPQGFLKQFPLKNVNPDSRDLLPEALTAKK